MDEGENNMNNENLNSSGDKSEGGVIMDGKEKEVLSLTSLKEQLEKMRYMHKSSVANYSVEIRKIKKMISVLSTKYDKKIRYDHKW